MASLTTLFYPFRRQIFMWIGMICVIKWGRWRFWILRGWNVCFWNLRKVKCGIWTWCTVVEFRWNLWGVKFNLFLFLCSLGIPRLFAEGVEGSYEMFFFYFPCLLLWSERIPCLRSFYLPLFILVLFFTKKKKKRKKEDWSYSGKENIF